jgi:hypothetical protein
MGPYAGVDQPHLMSTQESTQTKHGVWDPMPELTITSPYVDSRVASNITRCNGPCAGVDYNLTICRLQSKLQHVYHGQPYNVIRFVSTSAEFGICTVAGVNGTLVEDKMR